MSEDMGNQAKKYVAVISVNFCVGYSLSLLSTSTDKRL